MKHIQLIIVIAMLLATTGLVAADEGTTSIDAPVSGDQFLTGTTVSIDAAVTGDVFVAAETLIVNAPVTGDVIAVANTISLNAPISGKVIAFGGDITFNSSVLKVVAAGETITFTQQAVVEQDARIFGQTVVNNGVINRELKVVAESFTNNGDVGTITENTDWEFDTGFMSAFQKLVRVLRALIIVGCFVMGIVLVGLFGKRLSSVADELVNGTLVDFAVGIGGVLVTVIVGGLLAFTFIGLPLALFVALLMLILLLLASVIASLTVGRKLLELAKKDVSELWQFTLGFIVLRIVYWIPYAGGVIHVLVVVTAFGAILMTAKHNWGTITGGQ